MKHLSVDFMDNGTIALILLGRHEIRLGSRKHRISVFVPNPDGKFIKCTCQETEKLKVELKVTHVDRLLKSGRISAVFHHCRVYLHPVYLDYHVRVPLSKYVCFP